jgi:hypothetical protein
MITHLKSIARGVLDYYLDTFHPKVLLGMPAGWSKRKLTLVRGKVKMVNTTYREETHQATRTIHMDGGGTGTETYTYVERIYKQKFWLQTRAGERMFWMEEDYVAVTRGQTVTAVMHGDEFAGYVVHETREECFPEARLREVAARPYMPQWWNVPMELGLWCIKIVLLVCPLILLDPLFNVLPRVIQKTLLYGFYLPLYVYICALIVLYPTLLPVRALLYARRREQLDRAIEDAMERIRREYE